MFFTHTHTHTHFFVTLSISIRTCDTVYSVVCFLLLGQQVPDANRSLMTPAARAFSPLFISGKLGDNYICETCLDLFSLLSLCSIPCPPLPPPPPSPNSTLLMPRRAHASLRHNIIHLMSATCQDDLIKNRD